MMATNTTFYELVKPSYEEVADIEVINTNMDKIDTAMNNNAIGVQNAKNITSSEYSAYLTYNVGDYCIHESKLYKCITAIEVAEDFDSAKWQETKVEAEIKALQSDLITIESNVLANNAATHNAIFRGKDLTNIYTIEEMCTMISSGTFDDLFIGDYFDISISTDSGGTESVRCIFAGFDYYLKTGDSEFTSHHAVIVTGNCMNTIYQMNTTNTTAGGFLGSAMWTNVLPIYNTAFGAVFGSHLLSHRVLMTNSINETGNSKAGDGFIGCSNGWAWTDVTVNLLTEVQVYGFNALSSSFRDNGVEISQLPLFALDNSAKIGNRKSYWLRNVSSKTQFCAMALQGYTYNSNASSNLALRPTFCIG